MGSETRKGKESQRKGTEGTSVVVKWLRIHFPVWGDMGAQGTKIPHAAGQ